MKPDEFVERLEKHDYIIGDILVKMLLKYDHEEVGHFTNEILTYNGEFGHYEWLNDWDEGQQIAEIVGWVNLDDYDAQWDGFIDYRPIIFSCPICERGFDDSCKKCDYFKEIFKNRKKK